MALVAMIPEPRQYLETRRKGEMPDISKVMQMTAMGRGMYKMAERLGLLREERRNDGGSAINA